MDYAILRADQNPDFVYFEDDTRPADYVCPTCHSEWWHEDGEWDSVGSWSGVEDPRLGRYCPNCAEGYVTNNGLYNALKNERRNTLKREVVEFIRKNADDLRIIDAVLEADPDLFRDAALYVLGDQHPEELWEVARNEA